LKDFLVAYSVLCRKDILNFGAICFMDSLTSRPLFSREGSCSAHRLWGWIV